MHPNIIVHAKRIPHSLVLFLPDNLLHVRRGHGAQRSFSERMEDRHVGHDFAAYGFGEATSYACLQLQESIPGLGLILIPLVTDKLADASSLWKK